MKVLTYLRENTKKKQQRNSRYILLSLLLFMGASCNQNQITKDRNRFEYNDTIKAPITTDAGKPVINLLSDFPPPEIIKVPGRNGRFFLSDDKVRPGSSPFQPPEKKTAGFLVNLHNFNTEEGLALSSVLCGFKDKAGNLWFGTSGNGVSKYDGKSFTNYYSSSGLIHNLINEIAEDNEGNIWFATYGGVSKFDGISFTNFTMKDGLPNNDVLSIHPDREGTIWFGTYDGLSKYNPSAEQAGGQSFVNFQEEQGLPSSYISDIFEDHHGNIWFATYKGLCKYLPDSASTGRKPFKIYTVEDGLVDNYTRVLAEDKKGNLWIGTSNGVSKFDPDKEGTADAFVNYTEADGLINNKIMCVWIDKDNDIWFGTSLGLSRFEPTGEGERTGSFTSITTENGLPTNMIEDITEDNSGNLWICTLGGGLSRYDGKSMGGFTEAQGLPDKLIFSIAEDNDGNMWFGTDNKGIIKYDGQSFETFSTSQGLPDNRILALIKSRNGDLWMGSEMGLSKFDGKSFTNYSTKQGLIDDGVVSITEDRKGNLWVGTYEAGLSMLDGNSFTNFTTSLGLIHNTVWSILEDREGNLWFGTRGGVSKYNGKTFVNFTKDQGLADNKVSKVFEDSKGNLLIGTWGGGISILRKSTLEKLTSLHALPVGEKIFETFSTSEGLSNDVVYSILEDSAGNIFVGTSQGFTVLKGGLSLEGKNIARNGIEYFNEKTGYPIKDISNNHSMFLDSKGIIWAGTGDKLVRFDYNSVHRNTERPQVFIYGIKINNESISWHSLSEAKLKGNNPKNKNIAVPASITDELIVFGKKLNEEEHDSLINKFGSVQFDSIRPFYAIPENLVLPFAFNNITFDFLAIETARPELENYQYMLNGYDDNWSPVSKKTSASFGNIPEGAYTFILKTQNPEGIWSEPVTYDFTILPPWYRSWPAYLFYVLLLISGIFLVDRFQRQRLISRERQRAIKKELVQAKEIEKAYGELKSAQIQLIHAEKMASLGELTAGVAHEIQNPLNFVYNFSEVSKDLLVEMIEELENGNAIVVNIIADNVIQNLEKILHHSKRADAIVKGMLQHSRTSSGQKELTNINALADEYLRLSFHGLRAKDKTFNANFKTELDDSLPKINVIPQDIGRVLLNLINNAFYAVSERAKQNENGYKPLVIVITKSFRDKIEIRVKDNGNGIPDTIKEKIFQPFFTTKPSGEGTGLGLSLSYEIITKGHSGGLIVNSEENEGTIFIIHLPLNN